ncbi:hypothetical protein GE21DRAFT_1221407, partial [Neurospora crassa]
FIASYIDNIIVFNDTANNYLKYFKVIFKLFKNINFNITIKKSFVVYLSVRLLRYCINGLGIVIITDRIVIIRNI